MNTSTPLINGKTYTWADVTVNIGGTIVSGITSVSYSDEQEMEDHYGAGNYPVSRGYGKITCTGSLTLFKDELEGIMASAPNGRIQEIPEFEVIVAYAESDSGDQQVKTHILKNCRFKGNKRDLNTGDMKFEVQLDLLVSHIVWNA